VAAGKPKRESSLRYPWPTRQGDKTDKGKMMRLTNQPASRGPHFGPRTIEPPAGEKTIPRIC